MSEKLKEFIGSELLELWNDGQLLLASASGGFHDFSFVVFPAAKVYEGFLKKLFFEIGAITKDQYESERWRVGRALNPQLEKDLRHTESVYDRIVNYCGGEGLADELWRVWKRGRNQVFHFYPSRVVKLSYPEAREIVDDIERTMEKALGDCKR